MAITWLAGLVILIAASWQTWNDTHVRWGMALIFMAVAGVFSLLSLQEDERQKILHLGLSKLRGKA